MTVVAVHQPEFLPYPGFFHKMLRADIFILYDTAQYEHHGFQNRNRIKTPSGASWLTVPVKAPRLRSIREIELDNASRWGQRLWRTLEANYARARHFDTLEPTFRRVLKESRWEKIKDLNDILLQVVRRVLGLETELVYASTLPEPESRDPSERLAEMTGSVGGTEYLSGPGGREYLRSEKFGSVRLEFCDSPILAYPQLWGPFVPRLSIVDALFNCGPETGDVVVGAPARTNAPVRL